MNRPHGITEALMGWRQEVRDRIAELEQLRLRLEDVRLCARRLGGPEGERLEARAAEAIRQRSQQINDLRTSPE